ncbi:hypothetical protein DMP17_28610 [Pseudonocardia sp. TMWB2A]|uniref:hypothetical protein n=1 Tax=Pseudonocardia sp. TMWB2A TaxID=687430 RepID=UPI00307D7EA5
MTDALNGLDNAERTACRVAERVTGAAARAWDVGGRIGAVDAFLDYADGRSAAFEVTRAATDPTALQLDNLLGRDGFEWPLPGIWWWTVSIGDVRDLPRARQCFAKVVLLCEAASVTRPDALFVADVENLDADARWLVEESSVSLRGHPGVPAVEGSKIRAAMVTPEGGGGVVDDSLSGLNDVLHEAFTADHLIRRVSKLRRTPADERHLFLIVHQSDLRFDVTSALMFGQEVPPGRAWTPEGISHLWLAPAFSKRVLLGSPTGWSQAFPYDT